MKTRRLIATGLAALTLTASAAAAQTLDMNAPARKSVTVGSELERGRQAAMHAGGTTADAVFYAGQVNRIRQFNEQQNTDTMAFQLGLAESSYIRLSIMARVTGDPNAATLATGQYRLCVAIQNVLMKGAGPCERAKHLVETQQGAAR